MSYAIMPFCSSKGIQCRCSKDMFYLLAIFVTLYQRGPAKKNAKIALV